MQGEVQSGYAKRTQLLVYQSEIISTCMETTWLCDKFVPQLVAVIYSQLSYTVIRAAINRYASQLYKNRF